MTSKHPAPRVTPYARLAIQAGCVGGQLFTLLDVLELQDRGGDLHVRLLQPIGTAAALRILADCAIQLQPGRRRQLLDLEPKDFVLDAREWDTAWGDYVVQIVDAEGQVEFESRPVNGVVAHAVAKGMQGRLPEGKAAHAAVLPGRSSPR